MNRKFILDLIFLSIAVIAFVCVQRYNAKHAAKDYWESERIENAKRLFGDAWRDAL